MRFLPKILKLTVNFVSAGLTVFAVSCASTSHIHTRHILEGNDAAIRADYSTAVSHYEAALKAMPESSTAKRNLGIVYVKVGQYAKAKSLLTEVLPSYKGDVEILYFLGEASRGLEDYGTAVSFYQKALRIDSGDLRVVKALSWTWFKMKLYEKSLSSTEPLLRKFPNDIQLRLIIANNYNKLQRYQKSIDLLSSLEKIGFKIHNRDMVSAESERALLISALADAYSGQRDFKKAQLLYGEVLKTRPFLASALIGSAKCDMQNNSNDKALSKLERASRANQDIPEMLFLLGRIYERTDANKSTFYYRRFLLVTQNNRSEFANELQATKAALSGLERRNSTTSLNGR